MRKKYSLIILAIIFFLALFLRIYKLDQVPAGFFVDEASIGYNAYKILTTGRDEYGMFLPFFFRSLDDYKHPLAIYSDVPFVVIGGLTEVTTRTQSVFWGFILLIFLYLLSRNLFDKKVGLWATFIGASTPWLIHYNRVGFDYSVYVAFFTASLYFLTKVKHSENWIIPFFVLSSLTIYTYQPAKLLAPLLIIIGPVVYPKAFFGKKTYRSILGLGLFLVISIPLLISLSQGSAFTRLNSVSVFSSSLEWPMAMKQMIVNYFTQLSPSYLFWGEEPTFITRHFIGGLHPLLIVTFPFILIGLIKTIINYKTSQFRFILLWLIIYPIAGAITLSGPFTGRSIIGAPLFCILSAVGIIQFVKFLKFAVLKNFVTLSVVAGIIINLGIFINFYFNTYPSYSSDFWGWQYGPKEIIKYFEENEKNYDELFMIGEFNAPETFFRFYSPKDCYKCKIGSPETHYNPQVRQIFAVSPNYLSTHDTKLEILKTIYYPNNNVAFEIGKVIKR